MPKTIIDELLEGQFDSNPAQFLRTWKQQQGGDVQNLFVQAPERIFISAECQLSLISIGQSEKIRLQIQTFLTLIRRLRQKEDKKSWQFIGPPIISYFNWFIVAVVAIFEVITGGGAADEEKNDYEFCCEGKHSWQFIFGWLVLLFFLLGTVIIVGKKIYYWIRTPQKTAVRVSNNVRSEPETSQNLRSDLGNHGSSMREEQSQQNRN